MRAVFWGAASAVMFAGMGAYASDLDDTKAKYNFVPADAYFAQISPSMTECLNYEPVTNTCESIGNSVLIDGQIKSVGTVLLIENPSVSLILSDSTRIVDGLSCGDASHLDVEVETEAPFGEDVLVALGRSIAERYQTYGEICQGLFEAGDGYEIFTFDRFGNLIPGVPSSTITFFEQAPALRAVGEAQDL